MQRSSVRFRPSRRGFLSAGFLALAVAALGALMAIAGSAVLYEVFGTIIFVCFAFMGIMFLYGWFRSRSSTRTPGGAWRRVR
jgi:hypothetical protein